MPNVYDMRPAATLRVRLPDASNGARGRCPAAASWPYSVDVMPTITPQRSRSAALILSGDKKQLYRTLPNSLHVQLYQDEQCSLFTCGGRSSQSPYGQQASQILCTTGDVKKHHSWEVLMLQRTQQPASLPQRTPAAAAAGGPAP